MHNTSKLQEGVVLKYRFNARKRLIIILSIFATIQLIVSTAIATPTMEVLPTKPIVERGEVIQIRVKISTTEPINNIIIDPIPPEGFTMEPVPSAGIETTPDKSQIHINHLEARSEQIVSFTVYSPTLLSGLHNVTQPIGLSLKEPKSFVFNIFYNESRKNTDNSENVIQHVQTLQTNIRYTTNEIIYLFYGIIGILFGHIIKISTKDREDIEKKLEKVTSRKEILWVVFKHIFITRLPALLTISVVGFSALLVLAKESTPVNSWDQAMALGIGLAILTDEQLLSKIKPSS